MRSQEVEAADRALGLVAVEQGVLDRPGLEAALAARPGMGRLVQVLSSRGTPAPVLERLVAQARGRIATCPRCRTATAVVVTAAHVECLRCQGPRNTEVTPHAETLDVASAGARDGAAPAPALARASKVGDYTIERLLGKGGMGAVYAARRGSEPPVALKLLTTPLSEPTRKRLERECEVLARLDHPAIVKLVEVDDCSLGPFVAMELVEGVTLSTVCRQQGLALPETLRICEEIARALDHAHAHGIAHRDVKPGNVLLTPAGQVKVVDFGLASEPDPDMSMLTATGMLLGTPAYMSPEQVRAERLAIGPRTDIWSLGVMLYELATGTIPFPESGTLDDLFRRILKDVVVPPSQRRPDLGLPKDLDRIVGRCLEKEPALRYDSMGALADDLGRLRRGERTENEVIEGAASSYVLGEPLRAVVANGARFAGTARDGGEVILDRIAEDRIAEKERFLDALDRARGLGEAQGFVPILDVLAKNQAVIVVTPRLRRSTLRDHLSKGCMAPPLAASVGRQIAAALAAAHARDLVHGRVTPEAILVDDGGRCLVDGGRISRYLREDVAGAAQCIRLPGAAERHAVYLAPEQLASGRLTPAADVFAVGAVLFECLAGAPAFTGASLRDAFKSTGVAAPPLATLVPDVPPWLATVVDRALAREPGARFADARALAKALGGGWLGAIRALFGG